MFSLAIKNITGHTEYFFLMELTTQCELAKSAYRRLVDYSRAEINKQQSAIFFDSDEAFKVVADCTLFLSATSMIAKLLFFRKSKNADTSYRASVRASKLRTKIGIDEFPSLNSTTVRNHFEHADERLDKIIHDHPEEYICQFHISRELPEHPVVLRRFDPVSLSISFLGDTVDLQACMEKIEKLEILLTEAKKSSLDKKRAKK